MSKSITQICTRPQEEDSLDRVCEAFATTRWGIEVGKNASGFHVSGHRPELIIVVCDSARAVFRDPLFHAGRDRGAQMIVVLPNDSETRQFFRIVAAVRYDEGRPAPGDLS
jgi:hypothetical protein